MPDTHFQAGASALGTLKTTFELLTREPCPMTLDGRDLGAGLPPREISLGEVPGLLAGARTGAPHVQAVWRELVLRARFSGPGWVVAACALAYPGLAAKAWDLTRSFGCDLQEVSSEVLTGFLTALLTVDLEGVVDIPGFLCTRAYSLARPFARREQAESGRRAAGFPQSQIPQLPVSHTDLVLARAVKAGVLAAWEADWISATYLDGEPAADVARASGVALSTFYRKRARAEMRLAKALADDVI
jgi:hypothetical protein